MKSKLTREAVFEKLLEMDRASAIQQSDITIAEIVHKYHWGRPKSERYLDELVKQKHLVRLEFTLSTGKKQVVWRLPM